MSDGIVRLFTDGSCNPNPGAGGWGCIMQYGDQERERFGYEHDTTNNRMEMMAVLAGLRLLKHPCRVHVTSDSQYTIKGSTEWMDGWLRRRWRTANGEPVKNKELWIEMHEEIERHIEITWEWVKGHNKHPENERADRLADRGRLLGIAERDK